MSENTAKSKSALYPEVAATRYLIDPLAFAFAMLGGPVVVAVLGFWIAYIPVAALVMGGPAYLIIGTPVMMWQLSRHPATASRFSGAAFLTVIALIPPGYLVMLLIEGQHAAGVVGFFGIFGAIFAPIWGAVSGLIYRSLCRDIFTQPVSY